MSILVLLRHGESRWNPRGLYQGRADTELSELGRRQALLLGEQLRRVPLKAVYSSPLRRALETAQAVASAHSLEVVLEPGLTEMDHGLWSGLSKDDVERHFAPLLEQWRRHPAQMQMPGGENLQQVQERTMAVVRRIAQERPQETVALCTHDVVLKVVMAAVLGLDLDQFWAITLENASVSVIEWRDSASYLLSLNDTCHLGEARSLLAAQAL